MNLLFVVHGSKVVFPGVYDSSLLAAEAAERICRRNPLAGVVFLSQVLASYKMVDGEIGEVNYLEEEGDERVCEKENENGSGQ